MARLAVVSAAATFALVGAAAARAVRRVRVRGDSMAPTLESGDHLVVVRVPRWWPIRAGSLVALYDPRSLPAPEALLVKRVRALGRVGFDVRGDNPLASTDSRVFGPVPRERVVGFVVYRYSPAGRSGRVR